MPYGFWKGLSHRFYSHKVHLIPSPIQTFNVGTGLSDKLRKNPPKIGAIITYRFQELTRDGVPRFPSYIGEAVDKDEPKDAEIPKHRIINDKGKEDA